MVGKRTYPAGPVGGSTLHPLHPHLSDAPRDPDALSGHGVRRDAGARTGRARPRPLFILLETDGSCDTDCGERHGRIEAGDVAFFDYARPFRSAVTDYGNLMVIIARESVPAALLATEPHGLIFLRESGGARLIGAAMQEFYAQADDLTVSDAEARSRALWR